MKYPAFLLLASCAIAFGQGGVASEFPPQPAPQPTAPPAQSSAPSGGDSGGKPDGDSSFLGKDMPFIDPSTETATWDNKTMSLSDNRLVGARFEKYLNEPAATTEDDEAYQKILQTIMDKLSAGNVTPQSSDEAFQLLAKASAYPDDAKLCDAIAQQVYSAWLAKKDAGRVAAANKSLEEERKKLQWNLQIISDETPLGGPSSKDAASSAEWQKRQQLVRDAKTGPIVTRLAEIEANLKANGLKGQVVELQVKVEFQALIVQHFMQRRFQHVLIGTRFYRTIFADGDSTLKIGEDMKDLFSKSLGSSPTMSTVDSVANEIIRDVQKGVEAFHYLLSKDELESATKRLQEQFAIGEYLPDVRRISRDDKRRSLAFVQDGKQLLSAMQVRDYTLAEKLLKDMEANAKDFDGSKARAAIETHRQIAAMHIAKAQNAAVSGEKATFDSEFQAATKEWPLNPALKEAFTQLTDTANVIARSLSDFDQLLSQKNYRQIYDDKMRFITATAMYPAKQEQLRKVLEQMQQVDTAIIQAQEIEKHGDHVGAWESAEHAYRQFPDDNKLNQLRADLTTKAADFVRALRQAEDLEQKNQPGSGLAWYLKAQSIYPTSDFAKDGVQRLTKQLMPDAT